jgi:hypothetical protein
VFIEALDTGTRALGLLRDARVFCRDAQQSVLECIHTHQPKSTRTYRHTLPPPSARTALVAVVL